MESTQTKSKAPPAGANGVSAAVEALRAQILKEPGLLRVLPGTPEQTAPAPRTPKPPPLPSKTVGQPTPRLQNAVPKEPSTVREISLDYDKILERAQNGFYREEIALRSSVQAQPIEEPEQAQPEKEAELPKPLAEEQVKANIASLEGMRTPKVLGRSPLSEEQKKQVMAFKDVAFKYPNEMFRLTGIPDSWAEHFLNEHNQDEVARKVVDYLNQGHTWAETEVTFNRATPTLLRYVKFAGLERQLPHKTGRPRKVK